MAESRLPGGGKESALAKPSGLLANKVKKAMPEDGQAQPLPIAQVDANVEPNPFPTKSAISKAEVVPSP